MYEKEAVNLIEISKYKLCYNSSLALFFSMIVVIGLDYHFQFEQMYLIHWVTALMFLTIAISIRKGKLKVRAASNLLLSTGVLFITYAILCSGNLESPILSWFVIVPLISIWLAPKGDAVYYYIYSILFIIGCLILYQNGFKFEKEFSFYLSSNGLYTTVSYVLLVTVILIVGYDFEFKKFYAIKEIDERRKELANINQRLTEAKSELETAQKQKDNFIAQISHEMRTPMNAIVGITHLIAPEVQEKELIKQLNTSSTHLMNIIDHLLDASKMRTGKFTLEKVAFELRETFDYICNNYHVLARSKDINFFVDINFAGKTEVYGDQNRLIQLFSNVLNNAFKFTNHGKIELKVRIKENVMEAEIKDSGIGVRQENQSTIFELFSQSDDSIHLKYGGTGMGLSICKQIVELWEGTIQLSSEFGVGTIVRILLPMQTATEQKFELSINNEYVEAIKNYNPRIMIIDDNKVNTMVTSRILKRQFPEMIIDVVNDSTSVSINLLRDIDIILMDIQMPSKDGYQLTREIMSSTLKNKIKIIGLSAYALKSEMDKCLKLGMKNYLTKPVSYEHLIHSIYHTLNA
jgi:signal transduction histidine kinase/ActR/RegA family two-component response regulator